MRNLIGLLTNSPFWALVFVAIAIWSAFGFYGAGYTKGIKYGMELSQAEIDRLQLELQALQTKTMNTSFIVQHPI